MISTSQLKRVVVLGTAGVYFSFCAPALAPAQTVLNAQQRWEKLCEIRQAKFDRVLPSAMRENHIDMWIVAVKEGHDDPMAAMLGEGEPGAAGPNLYIFTDRGPPRIERAVLGLSAPLLEDCPSYDLHVSRKDLQAFVAERHPQRIAVDMSDEIGTADGLTYTEYRYLTKTLGDPYAGRLVSAEILISRFRSRHVQGEIDAYAQAGKLSQVLVERALSNEVITPGKTTLKEVAWWLADQQRVLGLGSSFGLPSVSVLGPGPSGTSNDHVIQPGDLLQIDWGVGYLNEWTDMKRTAYVLKKGETAAFPGLQHAFERGLAIRDVLYKNIKPGVPADEMLKRLRALVGAMPGYALTDFGKPHTSDPSVTEFLIGSHSTGDWGHGSGPWMGPYVAGLNPIRMSETLEPTNFNSIEFISYTVVPEWQGVRLSLNLEDDAMITAGGLKWLYPPSDRILLIK
jgi:Xaa-Pro aminopeptidase